MQRLITAFFLWAGLTLGLSAHAQDWLSGQVAKTDRSRAELLVHAPDGVAPGKTLWLGLQIEHAAHWHTYWKNSGDSGLPTELQWTLPRGVKAGDIAWPTPRKFPLGDLANYGYDGTVLLPVPVTVGADFKDKELDVTLQANWLICRQECIPEGGQFRLKVQANSTNSAHKALFEAAWEAAPRTLAAGSSQIIVKNQTLSVVLDELPGAWQDKSLEIFPEDSGVIAPGAAWEQAWDGHSWSAQLSLSPQRTESPDRMTLVVTPANPDGHGSGWTGVRLTVPVSGEWPAVTTPSAELPAALSAALEQNATRTTVTSNESITIWAALLGALVGGLILNLMPCVFPVLSIKVLAFARHANDHKAHRMAGLAYTAGTTLSFLVLGSVLLGLRAAGEQLGWGFQLQDPRVVAALAVLFTLIGLNLSGLFNVGHVLPSSVASLQARHPVTDAFLTGVLATAIASPCTAPFMGASLGLAIALPTAQALAVFGMLGLGMALPYLLASWWPAVARALPRPGAWMETFRQFMAFPMYGTVVWLLWVLGQQSGIDGAAALLMLLVALALLTWSLGHKGKTRRLLSGLALLGLAWLTYSLGSYVTRPQDTAASSTPTSVNGLNWEAWTAEKQATFLAANRPVLVDFTAAWCVTCQYNKRNALADPHVLQDAASKQVALLRADWTRRDPSVTAALAQLGRNGVPTYAILAPGRPAVVLSEILSAEEVRAALSQL